MVAQAGDGEELMRKAKAHKPDIAIVDIRMPPTHTDEGLRAAIAIRETMPDTGVLVLSEYLEEQYALELLADDAAGRGLPAEEPRLGCGSLRRGCPARRRGRLRP